MKLTGRYGRRVPKRKKALAPVLRCTVPAPPLAIDYGTAFGGWQMLGIDVAGDCGAVT